jgi:hypothetical protein
MRVSRSKQIRKFLRFYRIVYGISPPYSVSTIQMRSHPECRGPGSTCMLVGWWGACAALVGFSGVQKPHGVGEKT